ncbi:hypothetical protein Tsubulata_013370 [Turnera subulata]|uniref:Uncharacterized protein n=1 Tax=Turnera subulata TaxID=218843 RepID=A0A9Q0G3A4_9ROSI|nr:hypothetical protein Tsubulata_013370 [Turnera subulata]
MGNSIVLLFVSLIYFSSTVSLFTFLELFSGHLIFNKGGAFTELMARMEVAEMEMLQSKEATLREAHKRRIESDGSVADSVADRLTLKAHYSQEEAS